MLVFEPEETYLLENNRVGYWGPVTSSIDWCERNYVVSYFVGEWWSTLSNGIAIALALWGACVIGWLGRPLAIWERAIAVAAAFTRVAALPITDEIGFGLAAVFGLLLWRRKVAVSA